MQAALAPAKPAAAFTVAKKSGRAASRLQVVRASAEQPEQWRVQRRTLAGMLAALPVLLPATRALALLPDDDDEELIEKAKANRKARLASEKEQEAAFARSEGFINRADEKSLISVQKAVNGLAKSGAQLEAGDLAGAATTVSGGVVGELRSAAASLSFNDAAKGSAATLLASLSSLESAAKGGSAKDAKRNFVAAVDALQAWVGVVGIGGAIKGL